MKYISLFEKFESMKLSKILKYISKGDRKSFLSELKKLSEIEDIEISKLSDEMFTYLPYREGIKIKSKVEKIECPQCLGEGKTKKPWGTEGNKGFHYRYLDCKSCESTGKINFQAGKITDIKFWFNTDGKYLGKTCINGTEGSLDKRLDLFNEIRALSHEELLQLPTGTKVKIHIGYTIVGTIFQDNGRAYVIQNTRQGVSRATSKHLWNGYGNCSWRLDTHDYRSPVLLEPKSDISQDPLIWNFNVDFGTHVSTSFREIKGIVKDAEFCLILNLQELESLKNSPRSTITKKRKEIKGVKKTDDEIKAENIKRYIDGLSSKFKISEEVSDVSKIVPRLFGWSMSFFFVLKEINFGILNSITDLYFSSFKRMEYLKDRNIDEILKDTDISSYESDIKYYLRDGYSKTSVYFQGLSNSIKKLESESSGETLECINLLKKLGSTINERVLKTKIETLGDFELIMYKLSNIKSILMSRRYSLRNFDAYLRRMDADPQSLKSVLDSEGNRDLVIRMNKDIKSIISTINKM
jgi:hypothetical protein